MSAPKLEFDRGELINDRYEVIDLLEEGPVGLTYRVKHLKSGKFVRLTMLRSAIANAETKEQLVEAFRTAKELDHKGLPKLGELGDRDGVAYYTWEDFEGSTLRDLLQEFKIAGRQLAIQEAAQITIAILEALQALHDGGHVMRALRPEYVLVNVRQSGQRRQMIARVKLTHPGLWELVSSGTLAEDEFTRGEAQYLAPELKGIDRTPTPRADVYSAGVIFYEMVTGTAPVGTYQRATKLRPDLPSAVDDVCELALSHAPEDRYRTASDLVQNIQRIFQEPDLEPQPSGSRITALGWGLGTLLVVAVAVILYGLRSDPQKADTHEDAALRAEVSGQQVIPPADEVRALLAKHPSNMLYIPAGPYIKGRLHSEEGAAPHEVVAEVRQVDAFLIDAFEYPNLQGALPEFGMTYSAAEAKCEAQGKRLCTADEWEKACKGPASFIFSYGDVYDPAICGNGLADRGYKSGSKSDCRNPWSVFDMSGGYREWTATAPVGKEDARRVVKGGMSGNPERGTRCGFFTDESMSLKDQGTSLRCCRDIDSGIPPEGDAPPAAP